MRAMRLLGEGLVEIADVEAPDVDPDLARVRVEASALCGSEIGMLRNGVPPTLTNLGHEAVGIIESIPSGHGLAPGDRVGISGLRGCNECAPCKRGQEMFCDAGAVTQLNLHAEIAQVAPWTLRRLPKGVDPGIGVLLTGDGLGVPVRALRRVPSQPGERVTVIGLGPVGLSHVLVRAHAGAVVTAVEPSPARRTLAEALGAHATHAPGEALAPADLVIEATGIPAVIADAFELVSPMGTLLQSGECGAVEIAPSRHVVHREITYRGTWFYGREDYDDMLALHAAGLELGTLVTHDVPAPLAQAAVTAFLAGETGKVILRWS